MKKFLTVSVSVLLVVLLCGMTALALGGFNKEALGQATINPEPTPKRPDLFDYNKRLEPGEAFAVNDRAKEILDEVKKHKKMNFFEVSYYNSLSEDMLYLYEMDYTQARAEQARLKAIADELWNGCPKEWSDSNIDSLTVASEAIRRERECGYYADSLAIGDDLVKLRVKFIRAKIADMRMQAANILEEHASDTSEKGQILIGEYNRHLALANVMEKITDIIETKDYPAADKALDIDTLYAYQKKEDGFFGIFNTDYPDYSEELAAYLSGKSIQEIFG